jgi:hypothetical protein
MSDTIRAVLFRAARAECAAVTAVAVGYEFNQLDSGDMENATKKAFRIFKEREMPDVADPDAAVQEEGYAVYGDLYLSDLASRAIAALDALDIVIETVSGGDSLEQQFIMIRALLEELAPDPVPVVVPAPDVIPVQEPLAFPDAVK